MTTRVVQCVVCGSLTLAQSSALWRCQQCGFLITSMALQFEEVSGPMLDGFHKHEEGKRRGERA